MDRKIKKIVIASPSDTMKERKAADSVVEELNETLGDLIQFEVIKWETHVTPRMGRPQAVINDQLSIDKSDVFIGIIWTRFGTPTGGESAEGSHFESGTEEEFNIAYESWKSSRKPEIMIFKSARRASSSDIKADQLEKVEKFFEKFSPGQGHPGLYREYHSLIEFEKLLRRALTQYAILSSSAIDNGREYFLENLKKISHPELDATNENERLVDDFIDTISDRLLASIKKQTYIDNFNRLIVLEIDGENLKVSITNTIEYLNVKEGINYYSANPRFERLEHAQTYEHKEFTINGQDYLNEIVSEIKRTSENRQFPYLIKNQIPLIYDKGLKVVHKTTHKVPIKQFFHTYQLVFPCRNFLVNIMIKNNQNNRFRLVTGTFTSFNVHLYEKYKSEYRKDDVNTITIGKWALPGSGYSIALQDIL